MAVIELSIFMYAKTIRPSFSPFRSRRNVLCRSPTLFTETLPLTNRLETGSENVWRPHVKSGGLFFSKLPEEIQRQRRNMGTPLNLRVILDRIEGLMTSNEHSLIDFVKVYDQLNRCSGERQDILELFTGPRASLRNRLHDLRYRLHAETGWWIVVRGERLQSAKSGRRQLRGLGTANSEVCRIKGSLHTVVGVDTPGQCMRVRLSSGASLLLDVGSRRSAPIVSTDRLVLLSHWHPDHAGGVCDALTRGIPVLASPATIRLLHETNVLYLASEAERKFLCPVEPGAALQAEKMTLVCQKVPHSVGSVAWTLQDDQASLLYTGDLMLRSTVYKLDWLPTLLRNVVALRGRRTVLLEASRAHSPANKTDEVTWPPFETLPNDIVVVTNGSPERLLNSYVQLYTTRYRHDVPDTPYIIMSAAARPVLRACWDLLYHARGDDPDTKFLKPGNRWGFAESRALYWLDRAEIRDLSAADRRRFWFVDERDCSRLPSFSSGLVYDLRAGDERELAVFAGLPTNRFDDRPGWTQHSFGSDIAAGVRAIRKIGANVLTFHIRSVKHHKAFNQKHGLDVDRIGLSEISL